jgi:hypothetical protein
VFFAAMAAAFFGLTGRYVYLWRHPPGPGFRPLESASSSAVCLLMCGLLVYAAVSWP